MPDADAGSITFANVTLDSPDASALAAFYRRLLGWDVVVDEGDWVQLRPPGGGPGLCFQSEPQYQPPRWPSVHGAQQMMLHLELAVDDLAAACEHARAAGAVLAEIQPQAEVRVHLDPAGHPFCLFERQ